VGSRAIGVVGFSGLGCGEGGGVGRVKPGDLEGGNVDNSIEKISVCYQYWSWQERGLAASAFW